MPQNRSNFVIWVLILFLFYSWVTYDNKANGELEIYFLNIGQGDSIYIKMPDNKDVLIDGGQGKKVLDELGKVMSIGDREINLLIATHADADHIGGLDDVMQRYKVDEIWTNGLDHDTQTYQRFQEEIKAQVQNGATQKEVLRGDRKIFGEADLLVLNPFEKTNDNGLQNNQSIVTMLDYKNTEIIFTGDAEKEAESKMVNNDLFSLEADVIKVGHHGSENSTSEEFINAVKPKYAVISVGENNRYGHPTNKVLDLLFSKNISVYRTDKIGTITISSNGKEINFL